MAVETHDVTISTRGGDEVLNLTEEVSRCLAEGEIRSGTVTVFVIGSTAGITTTEFEPGLAKHDLKALFEKLAPQNAVYQHEETWHDDNGHSHVRASLLGSGLTVPLVDGRLTLGTWQQIVLIDFDTRPRDRQVVVQVIGE
ncbi:MAG: secondary thiamine-phosphate synthase enzyme YjbQ [Phycisphaerae bacterium]